MCVVGSRKASPYGAQVCERLISGLAGTNTVIVSGLALGIDGLAHRAALDAGLTTIAVLASGLNWGSIYPATHMHLAKEIVASGGALISEFPENYRPFKSNFPQRNRIMAGLSHAILVVEASAKSGTLITARLSLDYNRDVLAVPGSIFSERSVGPHMLIQNGATPITSSEELLVALGLEAEKNSGPDFDLESCTVLEKKILRVLSEPRSRVEILKEVRENVSEVNAAVSLLEMKGYVIQSDNFLRRKW